MAHDPTPRAPGSMTVPPWAGWEDVLTGLLLLVALVAAVAVVVLWSASVRAGRSGRAEWQAWLDARSDRRRHAGAGRPVGPPDDPGPARRAEEAAARLEGQRRRAPAG
jgi:hypothetical protein